MEQALSDIKVLDLTHYIAGPFCTRYLADYGADVIKIENPVGGDPARRIGPHFQDTPHHEKSGLFFHLNLNKRSITLDLKTATGVDIFKKMVKDVDIVVENFRPGVMESFGLSYETLEKINPALVMTSISNFGQTGPYRDYKASELVMNGFHVMSMLGLPEREPQTMSGNLTQYATGLSAAMVTMAALLDARYGGIGQYIDISVLDTMLGHGDRKLAYTMAYSYAGLIGEREPIYNLGVAPLGAFECKDGYVQVSVVTQDHWTIFCGILERLYGGNLVERFPSPWDLSLKEEFDAVFIPFLLEHTKSEIHAMAREARIAIAPLNTVEDLAKDPHLNERGFFTEVNHPVVGKVIQTGAPFKMSETPWQIKRPAPLLGQHNEEVYSQMIGYTKEDVLKLHDMGVI